MSIQEQIERLAIEQAVYKAIGADVATNDPDNLRAEVNQHYYSLYEQTGATGFEVRLRGQKVGTYSITTAKAEPEHDEKRIVTTDEKALLRWCMEHGCVQIDRAKVDDWIAYTGELPDGMGTEVVHVDAKPARISRTTVRIPDPFEALYALGEGNLEQSVLELMEGGN